MSSQTCYSSDAAPAMHNSAKQGWQQCYSAPNNTHYDAPAKMSDGRLWTQWMPDAMVNHRIQTRENIVSNWDYRQYMQSHGLEIIHYNGREACQASGLSPHYSSHGAFPASNVPILFQGVFDRSSPGYGYAHSDLKSPYLSREQLNTRLIAPSISAKQIRSSYL